MSSLRVVAISEMKRKGFSGKSSQEIPRQNYLFSTEQIILCNYIAKPMAVTVGSVVTKDQFPLNGQLYPSWVRAPSAGSTRALATFPGSRRMLCWCEY